MRNNNAPLIDAMPFRPVTLVDILHWRALQQPDQRAYTFLRDGKTEEAFLTYRALDQQVRALGALLQTLEMTGERALLLYPPGLDYVVSFLSCLSAGVIAVPAYPPSSERSLARIQAIVDDAQAKIVLTTQQILSRMRRWSANVPSLDALRWLATDDQLPPLIGDMPPAPHITRDMLAFLQYTSGSTGTPKGVMVNHHNLLSNSELIRERLQHTPQSIGVSWLPIFHDMGLIAGVLQPLYVGYSTVLMPPAAFLQRPLRWLEAISTYGGTTSYAPNFAYELCARRATPEDLARLDLSSWRVAVNGAESVHASTLQRFSETFASAGFAPQTFAPGYGLAEGTLMVACNAAGTLPVIKTFDKVALEQHQALELESQTTDAVSLVGCGMTGEKHQVVIVNPETRVRCQPGEVGEIWVGGASVTQGYWRRLPESEETFRAHIAGSGEGPFLRTGDLGFLDGDELFITGRIKDTIIIRGRNLYPQDIELAAEQGHPGLRAGRGAAFLVEVDQEERLVIVYEASRDYREQQALDEICQAVRRAVSEQYEVEVYSVVLIRQGSVPMTSSGKIQRRACRAEFLADQLVVLARSQLVEVEEITEEVVLTRDMILDSEPDVRRSLVIEYLLRAASKILRVASARLNPESRLSEFGLDSLKSAEIKNRIESDLAVELSFVDILRHPTLNEIADYILNDLYKEVSFSGLLRVPDEQTAFPLSYEQEQLWFLSQLQVDSPFYNLPFALRIRGCLQVEALQQSMDALVARYDAWRLSFFVQDGQPWQRVRPAASGVLELKDLSHLAAEEQEEVVQRLALQDACTPFDLVNAAPVRICLLHLNAEEHVLLLSLHHIIFDGWSVSVLARELFHLYEAFSSCQTPALPELPIRYVDYACWQRQRLQGAVLDNHLAYWHSQLTDLTTLDLPQDRPRPALQTYRGEKLFFTVSAPLVAALKHMSEQEGVTVFMTLFSLFTLLLMRYSGQDDIAVGTPVANRSRAELEGLFGFFVNTLVLRTDLSGNPSVRQLLQRVRAVCLDAYAHQEVSFTKVVEALQPERDLSRNPLFQVFFIFQNMSAPALLLPDLDVQPLRLDNGTSKFDLTLVFEEHGQELEGCFEYNTDLFDEETIDRLSQHLLRLFEAAVRHPDDLVWQLPLLAEAEQHQLLRDWNETQVAYPETLCFYQLFESQVERTPEADAVCFEQQLLTYRELNEQANQLAHYLRSKKVGAGSIVGICVERSLSMLVALLAVWKAGGAYVPLDPALPVERRAWMLRHAQVDIVLSEQRFRPDLESTAIEALCLDTLHNELSGQPRTNPESMTSPASMAYLLYTSGSTGTPKGVQVPHRALVNLLTSVGRELRLTGDDSWLALTTISFDIAAVELFLPLLVGARVIIAPGSLAADGWQLKERLERSQVTIMQATPVTWRLLLTAGWQGSDQLKGVSTGEALPRELAQQLRPRLATLWNMYGPTETTIFSTFYRFDADCDVVPIGYPVANTEIYILDACLQPVPVGVKGELYIGGTGLAYGYLGQADLTAERFIPHPFSAVPGARLYRSGDMARYQADGMIECLGRVDFQVKMRGFRIEPGEIENTLERHPDVRAAVVVVDRQHADDPRLLAYVIPIDEGELTADDLRLFLRKSLPEYMLPAAFIIMEDFPRTASGKVDRRALPRFEWQNLQREAFVAPRTPVEATIARIWEQVLHQERVGIHDRFFEIGGHSLLAAQVLSRICSTFQVELPLRLVFELPTVAEFTRALEDGLCYEQRPQFLPVTASEHTGQVPLSFAQQQLWFLEQLAPGNSTYSIPVAIRLRGSLDVALLEQALQGLVRRHAILRTTFATMNSLPVQVIAENVDLVLPVVDLAAYPAQEREALARCLVQEEVQHPFNLVAGPAWRVKLLAVNEETHVFVLTMHHIISDGWSMQLFFHELGLLYNAYQQPQSVALPDAPVQYADYVLWQRQWLHDEFLERQLAYWKQQLQDVAVLDLHTDYPRPPVQSYQGATLRFDLPLELTRALDEIGRQEHATLFMTLLAAFMALLMRYSGQEDMVVGTAVSSRNRAEFEQVIGYFVNTLALRFKLSGTSDFRTLLCLTREVTLDAYAHQDLPFEQIVQELHPMRDLSRSPLFQVMFTMQPDPLEAFSLSNLQAQPVDLEGTTAKFDLSVMLMENIQHGLHGYVEYNSNLFNADTIQRLIEHYQTLLAAIVADAAKPIAYLPLMSPAQQQYILSKQQVVAHPPALDQPLHKLFEECATRNPEATAVVYEADILSYADLDRRANQLAHYLISHAVGVESRVGICLERSVELIVAVLGVLKAGAAYIPLDPAYPAERLAFMLQDAQVEVLLTRAQCYSASPDQPLHVLYLDQAQDVLAGQPEQPVQVTVSVDHLAYVLYTSGSTGKPKGVCCTHAGVITLLADFEQKKALSPGKRYSLWTSMSFDVSVYEIFSALCADGSLHIVPEAVRVQSDAFFDWLQTQRIQSAYIPPFMVVDLAHWLSQEDHELRLERLLVGVEPIQEPVLADIARAVEGLCLINGYGPTEATVCVTLYTIDPVAGWQRITPLGRPVQNSEIYVLDRYLQPVPSGVPGEIYIGGIGLARGYFARPEVTAASFIPHPFSTVPGARLYKSGDLACYLPDGNLQFLRRVDDQVKIRGFRVELREIEEVLLQHPMVCEAVVSTYVNPTGDKNIAAYVVYQPGQALARDQVRDFLKQQLPHYMLPAAIVALEALPLTPSGKIDRRNLPAPQNVPEVSDSIAGRLTPVQELLLNIWCDVLGRETLDIHANFFDLGGHSLLATQLLARVRIALQVELPMQLFFEHPTIASMAECIASLSVSGLRTQALALVPRSTQSDVPLSFDQQRIYFLNQLEPESPFYNIPLAIRLQGEVDVAVLEHTLLEIARRHEILRTTFRQAQGQPLQVVIGVPTIQLSQIDLSDSVDKQKQEREMQAYVKRLAEQPFYLDSEQLWRVTLIHLNAQTHVLQLTFHHTIIDGLSVDIFMQELSVLYSAFMHEQPSPLPSLPVQYADYTLWQRAWLREEVLQQQLAYWSQKLAGAPALLALPLDFSRPTVQSYRGAVQQFHLPNTLVASLRELSRREGVTLFMMILAAFKVLLLRSSGQEDILVGSPVSNRTHPDLEKLIGCFVNTLVLRTDMSGDPAFLLLLRRIREVCLEAYSHQDVPFEQVVEGLHPERHLNVHPLFQAFFSWQSSSISQLDWPRLMLQTLQYESTSAKFDLSLFMVEEGSELMALFEYNSDLFRPETIARLGTQFQRLLAGIVAQPEQRISTLPLLGEEERLLLFQQQARGEQFPVTGSLHQLFEAQVQRDPQAIAVVCEGKCLSYGELNQHANHLAHYLRLQGVGPDVLVGICVERSLVMVVGLLGILKAGGAYVPLDPTVPPERLAFILQDAQVPVLLTQQTLLRRLGTGSTQMVCLDRDWPTIAQQPDTNPQVPLQPEHLAYVIYTSGSTGQPKGVLVTHANVVRLFAASQPTYQFNEHDVWSLFHSSAFDFAVWELWGALLFGGRAVIVPYWVSRSAEAFYGLLQREQVTVLNQTPGAFYQLMQVEQEQGVAPDLALRWVIFGGEAIEMSRLRVWWQRHAEERPRLVNMYGITETTVHVTLQELKSALLERQGSGSPIGRALGDMQVYILDQRGQLVPTEVAGELYVGGAGLARGYLGRPGLTTERFVPNSMKGREGERLYRTGDVGRYEVDGTIAYLGRLDHQVKVRGFRIELGEIEAALYRLPEIQKCVVVVRDDLPGGRNLIAYVVPDENVSTPETSQIQEQLRRILPDYMVPPLFMLLDTLPLNANGKIDRDNLPVPTLQRDSDFVAPRNAIEEVLADLWKDALGLERVGVAENFFSLGGHSLLATQLITRTQQIFKTKLSLRTIFESPTITGLSQALVSSEAKPGLSERIAKVLLQVRGLSGDELQAALAQKKKERGNK